MEHGVVRDQYRTGVPAPLTVEGIVVNLPNGLDLRPVGVTEPDFARDLVSNLYFGRGTTIESASVQDVYQSLAMTVRDRLVERRARTVAAYYATNPRFVYYLSAEFMLGRQLRQNLLYTGTGEVAREALKGLGRSLDEVADCDVEPGLGNGGLGRLAACLLDALATADVPAVGYGIRYDLGLFRQTIVDGAQVERPDDWSFDGSPWEFPQQDDRYLVGFYGRVEDDDAGRRQWMPGETVLGEPSHMLVPGYGTDTANLVRLWRARADSDAFDLADFADGRYAEAVEGVVRSENISKVLYPADSTEFGRELRLKQQYFLVSCSLRDIIRRFHLRNSGWAAFADKTAIQLNDTHPALAIPELMRLLVDEHGVDWETAWSITRRTFAYTCHTLLPEALETWTVALFERLLPRHLEIIYAINRAHLEEVAARFPGDADLCRRLSLIQEDPERRVRMAHLAVVGSHAVNGVAELHTRLLTETVLADFARLWPDRFRNVTNGITPRRFLRLANPRLASLITDRLGGDDWLTRLDRLEELVPLADDPELRVQWRAVKRDNKRDLAAYALAVAGIVVDPDALCDVHVKRFHEYKRQLLKLLHVVTLHNRLRADPSADVPRTVVFAGKAAPSYYAVKRIIQLINAVAAAVNDDPALGGRLTVVFLPDYNVSRAELIIPAADLSEQISMAGKEASGTGNMKLALNGAVTIGTLDGANIELRDRVGADNFFTFGLDATQAAALRRGDYRPAEYVESDPELAAALDAISSGRYGDGFGDVLDSILGRDEYLTLADYRSYVEAQDAAAAAWRDPAGWTRMSIRNTANCGFFSADRTVADYRDRIWRVDPVRVPRAAGG